MSDAPLATFVAVVPTNVASESELQHGMRHEF